MKAQQARALLRLAAIALISHASWHKNGNKMPNVLGSAGMGRCKCSDALRINVQNACGAVEPVFNDRFDAMIGEMVAKDGGM